MTACNWCGATSSIFWFRFGWGCDTAGNGGTPVSICDTCLAGWQSYIRARQPATPKAVER